jgi:hypothetical protein
MTDAAARIIAGLGSASSPLEEIQLLPTKVQNEGASWESGASSLGGSSALRSHSETPSKYCSAMFGAGGGQASGAGPDVSISGSLGSITCWTKGLVKDNSTAGRKPQPIMSAPAARLV